ncbi:hypothetical protein AAG906_024497 [Vitis piasezkii]
MTTKNQIFTSVISGSPMITSEKLVGSENYLSWSASVELWFMGQGYEDHLVTQEADIPEPKDYTNDIQRLYKMAYAIVHLTKDLDLSTYIGRLPLLRSVLGVMPLTPISSVPSLDDVFARLLRISSTRTLSSIALDSYVLWYRGKGQRPHCTYCNKLGHTRDRCYRYMEDLLAAHMARSSILLPRPPSSSASRTSRASIASVARLVMPLPPYPHIFSWTWILDSEHRSPIRVAKGIGLALPLPSLPLTYILYTRILKASITSPQIHLLQFAFPLMLLSSFTIVWATLVSPSSRRWFLVFPLCRRFRVSHVSLGNILVSRSQSLVHTDVWGPCRTASTLGFQYFVTFIDDYSRSQFTSFMSHHGILHQSSCAHTPQQNGVAERKNRHLVETARTLLLHSHIPHSLLFPDQPLYFLPPRVFGCTCFVHILTPGQDKLSAKAMKCLFLGYSGLEGLLLLFLETHRYFISADVTFFEDSPFFSTTSESLPVSEVYHRRPRVVAPLPFPEAPADSLPILSASPALCLLLMTYPLLYHRLSSPYSAFVSAISSVSLPKSTHEALSHPGWRQAMVDEMAALHSNGTWDLVVLPSGKSTVGCRWVYAVKVGPDGQVDRLKARLVAKGYTQVYGSDYGDTFSPVAKIASVRLLLSMAAMCSWPLYQLDIKNVFLHGDLAEEVYMEQPPGFVAQGESGLLKQSPRAWFSHFSSLFKSLACFDLTDHSVFYHHNSLGQCIYLVVYVDDIVITGSDQDGIQKLKQHLFTHFQTKDLGKLKYFLGIEIAQSSSGVVLSQRKYALDILEETGMLDCKPVDTPMDPNVKLVPGQGEPLGDPGRYRRLVGKLNYLTITRPDISFPVSVVSQFLQSPCDSHWDVVIRILRYIKSTPGQGVLYENRGHTQVVGYTDADWAGSPTDRRSTSGYCVFIGGNLISWKTEYRAMALATCELIWLRHLLELRFGKDEQMKLICDNQPHYILHPIQSFMKGPSILKLIVISLERRSHQDVATSPRIKYICNKLGAYDVYAPA